MGPSSIRKAIGAVKDRTSISIAKMSSNFDPELEILIVKSTNHDTQIPKIKYFYEILRKAKFSRDLVKECVCLISKRIEKTHDWVVALKCLILVHRLIVEGDRNFVKEIACANASGRMLSNMCVFRDESHVNSWDYTEFVRSFGLYLVKKVELMVFDEMWLRKNVSNSDELRRMEEREKKLEATHLKDELVLEKVLSRMERLQRLLQRVLNVRSRCVNGKHRELLFLAVTPVVKDSFVIYEDLNGGMEFLLECFKKMEYVNSVKTYGTYATVAKQFDDLAEFYDWCKGGVGFDWTSDVYPAVPEISDDDLRSMEESVKKKKANQSKRSKKMMSSKMEITSMVSSMLENNGVGMKGYTLDSNAIVKDMMVMNAVSDVSSAEEKCEDMTLSLLGEDQTVTSITPWEFFSDNAEPKVTSAADPNNADWQMVLVDSASNLPEPKVDFGDSFDTFMLNGMYDHGTDHVRQQLSGGSASSLALPWHELRENVLAVSSTEVPVQVVNQDPFSASLAVSPPPYVQMVELEKKFQLLQQEQKIWQEYEANGKQGPVSFVLNGPMTDDYAIVQLERMPHVTPSNDLGLL